MNPLIFIPSPRDIPAVKKWWHQLPYDKFIVKYKEQKPAYDEGREFFLSHPEYTHFVIIPDDVEVPPDMLEILLNDFEVTNGWISTISGYCNIDENHPHWYAIHPPDVAITLPGPPTGSAYYRDEGPHTLPEGKNIIQVGASGIPCQVITRELFEKVSWTGATNNGLGNFDWKFSQDCHKLGVKMYCDLRVKLWHRRIEQSKRIREWRASENKPEGYSFLLKAN